MLIVLDTNVAGRLTRQERGGLYGECKRWFLELLLNGHRATLPAVADYELRRGLLLLNASRQLRELDSLALRATILPATPTVLGRAASLWADLRRQGLMTAPDRDVNFDIVLGAHAQLLAESGEDVVIATENARHLSRVAAARHWREIA